RQRTAADSRRHPRNQRRVSGRRWTALDGAPVATDQMLPEVSACPLRARSGPAGLAAWALAAALQLLPGELAQRVRDLMLARVAAVQVDHRGTLAVVPHAIHQLAEGRASASGQGVS